MSVLAEGISVILRRSALETRFPGVLATYSDRLAPDICADQYLVRFGFATLVDAELFVLQMIRAGIEFRDRQGSEQMSLFSENHGSGVCASWLEYGRDNSGVPLIWLAGTEPGTLAAPANWSPKNSQVAREIPEDLAMRLYACAVANDVELTKELSSMGTAIRITPSQTRLELYALRMNAIHYAVYRAFCDDARRLQGSLDLLYAHVTNEVRFILKGDALLDFVAGRRREYSSAMGAASDSVSARNEAFMITAHFGLSWSGNVPRDVGLLFMHYCDVRNPLIQAFGASIFVATLEASEAVLQ